MFSLFLGFGSLALVCVAYAWDGLVRRRALVAPFPRGAAFGGQPLLLRRIGAFTVGMIAAILTLGCLVMALSSLAVAVQEGCHGTFTLGCIGSLAAGVPLPGWVWVGLCTGWFVLVWLLLGNPYQRVLVYGVWYYQDRVARLVHQALADQGLPPLADETVFTLEEQVRQRMRRERWLLYGQPWLDGTRLASVPPPPLATMMQVVLKKPQFQGASSSEQAAIEFLLTYFLTQAQQAQQMSPMKRFLVGRLQLSKLGSYGGRAV